MSRAGRAASAPVRRDGGDLLLDCSIQPGARRSEVVGWHDGRLRIRVHAPPVDGKANIELARFVAAACGLGRSAVRIERGEHDRLKTLRLCGIAALPEGFAPPVP